ncbi:MAG: HAD family hydrolase [Chloroflexota bacterium]
MLKAIIFDLDGVLVNSEPLMRYAFTESYRRVIGAGEPPIDAYLENMGVAFPQIMDQLGLPHEMWQPFREICQKNLERVTLFPEVVDLLEWAQSRGIKCSILTGKDRERTLELLAHFGLQHYFDAVIASDQLCRSKPDPEGMLRSLDLLSCAPEEAVMIGDAVSDVECAHNANVRAIAVTWGIKPERIQTLCCPDYIVHDWQALAGILQTLEKNGHRAQQPS